MFYMPFAGGCRKVLLTQVPIVPFRRIPVQHCATTYLAADNAIPYVKQLSLVRCHPAYMQLRVLLYGPQDARRKICEAPGHAGSSNAGGRSPASTSG